MGYHGPNVSAICRSCYVCYRKIISEAASHGKWTVQQLQTELVQCGSTMSGRKKLDSKDTFVKGVALKVALQSFFNAHFIQYVRPS